MDHIIHFRPETLNGFVAPDQPEDAVAGPSGRGRGEGEAAVGAMTFGLRPVEGRSMSVTPQTRKPAHKLTLGDLAVPYLGICR